jgi:hypothetical protein
LAFSKNGGFHRTALKLLMHAYNLDHAS